MESTFMISMREALDQVDVEDMKELKNLEDVDQKVP